MNKNTIEISAYGSIAYALVLFNVCLVCVCVILTNVSFNSPFDLISSETIETID